MLSQSALTKNTVESLLEGLNEHQRKAAVTTEGPVLIIAGAGSGKTRVLTFRIAYLLQQGIHPSSILALTFTNKAAKEMRERITHLVGDTVYGVMAGTFHSVFARILRQYADLIGYNRSFSIYDTDDQLSAVKAIMVQLGISQQVLPANGVRGRISSAKNAMISWQQYSNGANSVIEKQTAQIFQEYEARLKRSNAMDFDDLLLNMIRLLQQQPDVLDQLQERFRYIMVDEYQDTNKAQYKAVELLARKYRNLCVVGDDAQSIYRWRGADIQNILDFERDYPKATTVRLEQNYRSTKTILAAADSVIKNNSGRLKKELWTDNAEGEKILVLGCRDDREEAETIMKVVRTAMRESNLQASDVAVLYRTNAQSQLIEDAMRRANVAYHIVSGVSFYKRKEIKDTLAYLRVLVNPSDTESILRIINEPSRGIGNTTMQRLQDYAVETNTTLFETLKIAENVVGIQKRSATSVQNFVELITRNQVDIDTEPPALVAQRFMAQTGLADMYRLQNTDESQDRWNNIDRLLSHIQEQYEFDETLTLSQYIEQISLLSDADDEATGGNRVSMMTMHAAKGLEYPMVVIAGMEQGLFPLAKAEQDIDEREEERRLFYVGITRAKQHLVLTYAERRFRFGEMNFSRPSMFIGEIDPACVVGNHSNRTPHSEAHAVQNVWERGSPKRQSEFSQMPEGETYSQLPSAPRYNAPIPKSIRPANKDSVNGYTVGQQVNHPMFGIGTIMALSGSEQSAKATVMFNNGQRKQLMLAFAKLEVV
ncbi:MAG: UvrD-helicase domain-containing protein [Ignavibacteria bacterium]|nr:UvrD-helicase domain-containing protein [Ignavibacteria bacterium]